MSAGPFHRGKEALERALSTLEGLRGFGIGRIPLRAAALTYLSLVSLVPLLAIGLFGLQALGLVDLGRKVRSFLFDNLAVGVREEVAEHLARSVANAGQGLMAGGIGIFLLALSAILLLRNIQRAFDDLWGQQRSRPLSRQLALYLGVLVAGPLALGLSLAVTAALKGWAIVYGVPFGQRLFSLLPFALSALGFFLLYKIAPAAKVHTRAALISGIAAAGAWEIAKVGYASWAVRSIQAGSIYGPLAALPVFLVWIYLSWLIVLFGARVAFAIQHPERLCLAADPRAAALALERCALRVAIACAGPSSFSTPRQLAHTIDAPEDLVRTAISELVAAGILRTEGGLELCRPPAEITAAQILAAVRIHLDPGPDSIDRRISSVLEEAYDGAYAALQIDLETLMGEAPSLPGAESDLTHGLKRRASALPSPE